MRDCVLRALAPYTMLRLLGDGAPRADIPSPPMGSPHSYSLGPEVQFLVDQLDEFRVAEGEEVDDLIDSSQKFIPPEVSLKGQVRGRVSSVTQMGIKAIIGPQ